MANLLACLSVARWPRDPPSLFYALKQPLLS